MISILLIAASALPFSTAEAAGLNLKAVTASELPTLTIDDADQGDFEAGSRALLKTALERQLAQCLSQNQNATWSFAGKAIARKTWCTETARWFLEQLKTANSLNELYLKAKTELNWYQSTGKPDNHEVEFTGYYFPVHKAKLHADAVYHYPVYKKPVDLVQVNLNGQLVWRRKVGKKYVPYFTRQEIVNGALKGKGLELAYLDNPVDPYILEVQGSGALLIQDDGSGVEKRIIVNYAAQNGQDYVSLGKLMRAAGVPEEYINLQGIKKYFTEVHPEDWLKFSNQNPSCVFYQLANDGPYGASTALLTPKHSIAVDLKEFPLGAMGLIQTDRPSAISGDQATAWKPFSQFIIAQDTGGAIQSPGRVDVFWGEGNYAEVAAGRTDRTGSLFFAMVPKKKH